jgi:hypothetical protein
MAAVEYKFMQPRHADRYLPIEAMTNLVSAKALVYLA